MFKNFTRIVTGFFRPSVTLYICINVHSLPLDNKPVFQKLYLVSFTVFYTTSCRIHCLLCRLIELRTEKNGSDETVWEDVAAYSVRCCRVRLKRLFTLVLQDSYMWCVQRDPSRMSISSTKSTIVYHRNSSRWQKRPIILLSDTVGWFQDGRAAAPTEGKDCLPVGSIYFFPKPSSRRNILPTLGHNANSNQQAALAVVLLQ